MNSRRFWISGILTFTLLLGIIVGAIWWFDWRFHVTTDDAYVHGDQVIITSQIDGRITEFFADNTDIVHEGQVLITLDPTDKELAFNKAQKNLALAAREVRELQEQAAQYTAKIKAQSKTLEQTRLDYDKRKSIANTPALSLEDYQHSKTDMEVALANIDEYKHQLDQTLASLGQPPFDKHPKIEAAITDLKQAYINLMRCKICSPATGYIAQRSAQVGQWVTATKALMSVIPLDNVWVEANFKETQLEGIRIGQPAEITADIYGNDVLYKGTVVGIIPGSGSVFSLLPPQNATGNWIKIVQRIPVKIQLDPRQIKEFPLMVGLSVNVDVDVRESTGHRLAKVPPTQAVAKTTIYDIPMKDIDALISQLVQANLNADGS